ncbi:MAG: anti-sigma factor [Flavobacteriales bacterium]
MSAQEIIASGLLEAYVLGDGSLGERALVEQARATEPTVRAELDSLEEMLEKHARAHAVTPSADRKLSVLDAIGPDKGKVIPLASVTKAPPRMNWLAAAAIGGLLLSGAGNYMLYDELNTVRNRLSGLESDRAVMAQELQVQQASMQESQDQLAVVFDPAKHLIPLAGQVLDPEAAARIFMDTKTSEVYIDVVSLPTPPPGKQYQLWAQVDGKMVDAGLLDIADNGLRLQRMKTMPNAKAFGVTLEKEGGSQEPTLSALYLFGPVG